MNDSGDPALESVLSTPTEPAVVTHVVAPVAGSAFIKRSLPPAFAELILHGGSQRASESPETIAASAEPWAYLGSLERIERRVSRLEALQVRLRVVKGTIGVGLLTPSGSAFLDVVDGLEPGDIASVSFFVRGLQHVGPLVVRNAGVDPVEFEWLGVDSFQLKTESDILKEVLVPTTEMVPVRGWNRYYGSFAATAEEGIRGFLFELLRAPLVMPWRIDLRVLVTPGEEASRALFVSGTYEPASLIVLQRFLFPGAVLVDVGANVGLYTLMGSRCVGAAGHVYSFEPSSRERENLQKNVALNHCDNVTVIGAAASDRTAQGALRVAAGQHRGQNTLAASFAYPGVGLEREESVNLVSLDDQWRSPTMRRPDVIKIDAEGSEMHVLRGAAALLREARPVIMFEINDTLLEATGSSRSGVESLLSGFGYRLYRLEESTAALVPMTTLHGADSENFVALPPGREASK